MKRYTLSSLQKFIAIFLVLLMFHWVLLVLYPNGMQMSIFFGRGGDFMADFFNVLRYIATRDPYFTGPQEHTNYLPLPYMLLFPFSRLDNYSAMSLRDCWHSIPSLISMVFFTLISCFMFYFSLKALCDKYKVNRLILIPLMLSGFFIRAVERGNLILISASCTMFFLALYDSENKRYRNLAVVMLSISAVMKVYPALFGLVYLRKKMYREFFEAVVLSVLLGLLPFLFFKHGFENIPRLLENLVIHSKAYGSIARTMEEPLFNFGHYIYNALKRIPVFNPSILYYVPTIGEALVKLLAVIALIASLFVKSEYSSLILIALGIMFIPDNSGSYCGLYLFPAIIYVFYARGGGGHKFHKLFYLLYLSPLQFRDGYIVGTWPFIAYLTLLFLFINLYHVTTNKDL